MKLTLADKITGKIYEVANNTNEAIEEWLIYSKMKTLPERTSDPKQIPIRLRAIPKIKQERTEQEYRALETVAWFHPLWVIHVMLEWVLGILFRRVERRMRESA